MSTVNGSDGVTSHKYDDTKRPPPPSLLIHSPDGSVLQDGLLYLSGFGNSFQSEALAGALPIGQNNPQRCPYGAYCELLTGTSFTAPRAVNQRTWMYRTRPTAGHPPMQPVHEEGGKTGGKEGERSTASLASASVVNDFSSPSAITYPGQMRWAPFPLPPSSTPTDFLQGLHTVCGAGSPAMKHGLAIHVYAANASMHRKAFTNSDGDMLLVPQQGTLHLTTELGRMQVAVGHIAVVQRGVQWKVDLDGPSRGYVLEVYDGHFRLPELGVIGSNGLANPRDFLHPTASYTDAEGEEWTVLHKYCGRFFHYPRPYCPFNVIAWHGNLVPYMFDLNKFVPAGAIRIDHLDPSIFTVLTCPTTDPGTAAADFVIFPPRWAVQEGTFRPPWYHRNTMSEFMGNVYGRYEARPEGFLPGGATLHLCMVGHGPDSDTFERATGTLLTGAHRMPDDSLAFMFETAYMCRVTEYSRRQHPPDERYTQCWQGLQKHFDVDDVPEHIRRRGGEEERQGDSQQQSAKGRAR